MIWFAYAQHVCILYSDYMQMKSGFLVFLNIYVTEFALGLH